MGVLVERLRYVILKLKLVEVWGRGNEGEERQETLGLGLVGEQGVMNWQP